MTNFAILSTITFRKGGIPMLDKDKEKRLRAVKIAKAINSIEGVPLPDKVKQISERWANGEITSEQMKKEVIAIYKGA